VTKSFKKFFQDYKESIPLASIDLFFGLTKEGVASFLMLYLIHVLLFKEVEAYALIGVKDVVAYLLPFLMALTVSSYLKGPGTLIISLILMGTGCGCISLGGLIFFKIGLSFFLCGYALGRPLIPLLLTSNMTVLSDKTRRLQALYALGSGASLVAPLWAGLVSYEHLFLLLGVFCFIGATWSIFSLKKQGYKIRISLKEISFAFLIGSIFSLPFFIKNLSQPLLFLSFLFAFFYIIYLKIKIEKKQKKFLYYFFMTLTVMVVYFILQNQQYLLFPFFIESEIKKSVSLVSIPTPWFYMLEPLCLLFFSPFLSRIISRKKTTPINQILNYGFWSFVSMAGVYGFCYFSTLFSVYAPLLIGMAFCLLFIGGFLLVPLATSFLTEISNENISRKLMGFTYLTVAIAKYFSSLCAIHSDKITLIKNSSRFQNIFLFLFIISIFLCLFFLFLYKIISFKNEEFIK
jgi:dipeptide/tripeptide permease